MIDQIFCDHFTDDEKEIDPTEVKEYSDADNISKYYNNGIICNDKQDPTKKKRFNRPALV